MLDEQATNPSWSSLVLRCIGPLSLRGAGDGRGHVPHTRIASAIENPQVGKTLQSTREEGERAAQERRGAEVCRRETFWRGSNNQFHVGELEAACSSGFAVI